jgi:leukotriene-A4 hydrolase
MENPLLTFASPTIIIGDKSAVNVAIHEIAHSWTGNTVTCQNWGNFWINEGFTVFLERKGLFAVSPNQTATNVVKLAAYIGNQTLYQVR